MDQVMGDAHQRQSKAENLSAISGGSFNFLITFVLLISTQCLHSQSVNGSVLDQEEHPVAYANILLLRAQDSTLTKGVITGEDGSFSIDGINSGRYYLKISLLGYEDQQTAVFQLNPNEEKNLPPVVLNKGIALEAVTVAGTKPLFEKKSDRMIINVESSEVAVGSSALEILRRSPGVQVNDQSSSISINGKGGVSVLINGRPINLPEGSAHAYLQGINANNITNVEVLNNPPANVDAQGNAGFINIILKENTAEGINGSLAAAGGIGTGLLTNNNLSLSLRKKRFTMDAFYNLNYDDRDAHLNSYREFSVDNDDIQLDTRSFRRPAFALNTFNFTLGYRGEKWETGGLFNLEKYKWVMDATNNFQNTVNGMTEEEVISLNWERNVRDKLQFNYYLSFTMSENATLDLNLNYITYETKNPTTYDYTFFDGAENITDQQYIENTNDSEIDTYTAGVDLEIIPGEQLRLEVGAKLTVYDFLNEFSFYEVSNDIPMINPELSNTSELNESVMAGFAELYYSPGEDLNLRAGLRYEYTDSELTDLITGPVVDRTYGYFFPGLSVDYKISDDLNIGLSYSTRINRPSFWNLAPFFLFIDPDTFITGNPSLQPSRSYNADLTINVKDKYLNFNYNYIKDPIGEYTDRYDAENDRNFYQAVNLESLKAFSVSAGIPLKFGNHFQWQNIITYRYREFRDNAENNNRMVRSNSIDLNSTLSVSTNNDYAAEVVYNFIGPQYVDNTNFNESYHQMDISIQKKISEKWGTIGFKILDVFNDNYWAFTSELPENNYRSRTIYDGWHTTFQVTWVKNFGKQNLKETKERKTGSEEEQERF